MEKVYSFANSTITLDLDNMAAITEYYHKYNIWEYINNNYTLYDNKGNEIKGDELDNITSDLYDICNDEYDTPYLNEDVFMGYCEDNNITIQSKDRAKSFSKSM